VSFERNIVKIKITYLIPILLLLFSCNQKENHIAESKMKTESYLANENSKFESLITVADTITNWQFYKDSELLFKSNMFDSNRFTAKIKTSDNYECLILIMFYDFNDEVIKRKIELVYDKKVLATFVDENRSRTAFRIPKSEIDKIIKENLGKDIYINYSDPITKNGMTVGVLKFTNE
jgi:hypothetical protein